MDQETLDFYERRAAEWAAALPFERGPRLDAFLDRLPAGASILELGCGDGRDAAWMSARGFEVHPSDGSPTMARLAGERLGREVPVRDFADLDAIEAYDAVWCQASLLHLREDDLPGMLERIHDALKVGGWHWASYKGGTGGHRDEHGRFYSYIPAERLEAAYRAAGNWTRLEIASSEGRSFGGIPTIWHEVLVRK